MAEKITSYVHVTVTAAARGIRQQVVDVPLLMTYHTKWADRVREYNSLGGLVSDGFSVYDPTYLMAQALLSQDRKVSSFKVGRRALAPDHHVELTVTGWASGTTVAVSITNGGVTRTYSQTAGGVSATAEAAALAILINADTEGWGTSGDASFTCTDALGVVTINSDTTGKLWFYDDMAQISLEDVTTDPGVATDLAAIRAEDDDWYAVLLDSSSALEGDALATACAALEKFVLAANQDTQCEAGAAGLGVTMATAAYTRAGCVYSPHSMGEYPACASLGQFLPWPPGSIDAMFKTYVGVTAADLSATAISALKADYMNHYVQVVRDAGIFQEGVVSSGQYFDVVYLKDYLTFRIREAIWDLLRKSPKIPYTDKGAKAAGAAILSVIKSAARNAKAAGGEALTLTDDEGRSTFSFDFIPAADQAPADISNRIFRGLTWRAELSSSIRQFYITGELV